MLTNKKHKPTANELERYLTLNPSETSQTPMYFVSQSRMCLWQPEKGLCNPALYAYKSED